jgi:hypothetical protein
MSDLRTTTTISLKMLVVVTDLHHLAGDRWAMKLQIIYSKERNLERFRITGRLSAVVLS